jgi:coenzyme F420-0:L-glutamate ligase / coenzyme F420-1:gamma-L-glutamate ligase
MAAAKLELTALEGIPLIQPGDDLARLIDEALRAAQVRLADGDILVLAQKIVSKAEGRYVELGQIEPSDRAKQLAQVTHKDARLVEVILRESRGVVRARQDVLIVEHRLGYILANAGVDASNVGDEGRVLLLPEDPEASCVRLREYFKRSQAVDVGVLVNDSWGRAWRMGTVGSALGVAGVPAVEDLRGRSDLFGRKLRSTEVAVADELAAAASLIMGQAGEGHPVVHARGLPYPLRVSSARELLRPESMDLFR